MNKKKKTNQSLLKKLDSLPINQQIIILGAIAATFIAIALVLIFVMVSNKADVPSSSLSEDNSISVLDDDYDKDANKVDATKYVDTVLAKSEDAGEEYIDETLFIGDSNTARFMMYGKTTLNNTIGVVSMGIQHVTSKDCVYFEGYNNPVTIPEAVKIMQPRRIVMSFGTNNTLGWSTKTFIAEYKKTLAEIEKAYPHADIIINSVPPVAWYRGNENIKMQTIDGFNTALADMADELDYKFLNSAEDLKDTKTGFAKENYTLEDGIHLNMDAMDTLFNYIRTHSYITEDTRPTLKPIPSRKETPPGIITSDPLFVPGQTAYDENAVKIAFVVSDTDGNAQGGTVEGAVTQTVTKGAMCTAVTAKADSGYEFANWACTIGSIADVASPSLTFIVPNETTQDIVVTAIFKKVEESSSKDKEHSSSKPDSSSSSTPDSSSSSVPDVVTGISISGATEVESGGVINFNEIVDYTGSPNIDVNWSTTDGKINAKGKFTAPEVTSDTLVTVTVSLAENPSMSASMTVAVKAVKVDPPVVEPPVVEPPVDESSSSEQTQTSPEENSEVVTSSSSSSKNNKKKHTSSDVNV